MVGTNYVLIATVGLFVIELIAGRHRRIYNWNEALVVSLCLAIGLSVTQPLVALSVGFLLASLLPAYRGVFADVPFVIGFPVTLVIVEFCFYWVHRWAHDGQTKPGLAWLWKLHRTHHSGKYMNVLTTIRVNPMWSFVVPTPHLIGVALYLGQGKAAAATMLTIRLWNVITHSNFRWDDPIRAHPVGGGIFGAIERIVVSPGIHHTHHGYGHDGATYRNYAVTLSFLDRLFGTLYVPSGRPARYGLPGPNPHWTEEVLFPIVWRGEWFRKMNFDQPSPSVD